MLLQTISVSEYSITARRITFKWFLTGMNKYMCSQIDFHTEFRRTIFASCNTKQTMIFAYNVMGIFASKYRMADHRYVSSYAI